MRKSNNNTKKNTASAWGNKFGKELARLKKNVTTDDRLLFVSLHGGSLPTVSRYLNGMVSNFDYAAKMITFFKEAQLKRSKLISK